MPQAIRITNALCELIPVAVAVQPITIAAVADTLESLGSFTFDAATKLVQVAIETGPVRTDPSGNAPTASAGQPVLVGQIIVLSIAEAKKGKWIRSTSTSASAQISQYTFAG